LLQIEYEVESCSTGNEDGNDCLHVKRTNLSMKNCGYVIYGVAHQHSGGTGSMLYGQLMFNVTVILKYLEFGITFSVFCGMTLNKKKYSCMR